MLRRFALPLAAVVACIAQPALAQSGYYTAAPAAAASKASVVTRSTVWKCADGTCTASRAGERDAVMCELLVARVGTLSAFSAGTTRYDADALAKCNARAR